jgi:hypothetical protein
MWSYCKGPPISKMLWPYSILGSYSQVGGLLKWGPGEIPQPSRRPWLLLPNGRVWRALRHTAVVSFSTQARAALSNRKGDVGLEFCSSVCMLSSTRSWIASRYQGTCTVFVLQVQFAVCVVRRTKGSTHVEFPLHVYLCQEITICLSYHWKCIQITGSDLYMHVAEVSLPVCRDESFEYMLK